VALQATLRLRCTLSQQVITLKQSTNPSILYNFRITKSQFLRLIFYEKPMHQSTHQSRKQTQLIFWITKIGKKKPKCKNKFYTLVA
jgi:hypothetical protein